MIQSSSSFRKFSLGAFLGLLPALAQAHPGHPEHDPIGFFTGALHPLGGLDHLLALVAIGLWAVQLGGRALWLVPLTFAGVMTAGAAFAMNGVAWNGAESGIVASLFLVAVLLMAAVRLPLAASIAIAGLFALG